MRRSRAHFALATAAVLASVFALSGSGCDVITSVGPKSCDQSAKTNPPTTYRDGTVEGGVFMSSPWDQKLLYFPGGIQIRIEHHLGAIPRAWTAYLAFDEAGVAKGPLSTAAGNQVELIKIDDQAITVKNGSCADYFLLVTAQLDAEPTPAPSASQ